MKNKCLLIVFLTLGHLIINAQYIPIPFDTNHVWRQSYSKTTSIPPAVYTCDYMLTVKNNTVINGKTYHVLQAGNFSNHSPYPFTYNGQTTFYLRQDTILKRVITVVGNQEKILYNFNKNVGDTANLYFYGSVNTTTLSFKDSVLLNDGLYHKRYYFFGVNNLPVIEGVGSMMGVATNHPFYEINDWLTCFTQTYPTLKTIFHLSGNHSSSCQILTALPKLVSDKEMISIFPNPGTDIISIGIGNIIPNSIEIKNILGQTILQLHDINQKSIKVDVSDFMQGLYFVKVNFSDKNIIERFVKN